jgi:hypothetical protein
MKETRIPAATRPVLYGNPTRRVSIAMIAATISRRPIELSGKAIVTGG